MKFLYLSIFFLVVCHNAEAQHARYSEKDCARDPVWISMIKDTSTNYFEAEKAFKIYFDHHAKPEGENEEIGEHAAREKKPSKKEQRKMQQQSHLRMDVKRYERWHDSMKPFVQADGSILTPTQRLEIWKAQQSKK